jgi:DNA-binding transcriptional LysR family regulator
MRVSPKLWEQLGDFEKIAKALRENEGRTSLKVISGDWKIPASSLQYSVRRLETIAGKTLINRESGLGMKLSLTDAGEQLASELVRIMSLASQEERDQAIARILQPQGEVRLRLLMDPVFLDWDCVTKVVGDQAQSVEVLSSNAHSTAVRRVVRRECPIAMVLGEVVDPRVDCSRQKLNVVLVSGDSRLLADESGAINYEFVRNHPLCRPATPVTLDAEFQQQVADHESRCMIVDSVDMAISMARARLAVAIIPCGDFTVLHLYRKTGLLVFSLPMGTITATLVTQPPSTLSEGVRDLSGRLRQALSELSRAVSPYLTDNLRRLPAEPGIYSGVKYAYFGDLHPPKKPRPKQALVGSGVRLAGEAKWYAEYCEFQWKSTSDSGTIRFEVHIQNVNADEPDYPSKVFRGTATLHGEVLSVLAHQTNDSKRPLSFTSAYSLFYEYDNGSDKTVQGVWLGVWWGLWKNGPRQHAYPSLLSDRPLSPEEILRYADMIELFSVLRTTEFNISVNVIQDAPPPQREGRRSTPRRARTPRRRGR